MASISALKTNCRKIVAIGRNYADHITELNSARPKQPFFFLKPPSSILLPSSGPVQRPRGVDLHYEVELGLVMGQTLRDYDGTDAAIATDAIEAYILAIDLTARNVQAEAKKKGLPWTIAKGFDTFTPVSRIIPKTSIPDPHNLLLHLSVVSSAPGAPKEELRQSDSTDLMLFRIPRLLSDISKVMTLEKGDIVLTGTPKGVGPVVAGETMVAGCRVDGKEVEEGRIEVAVVDREGGYVFGET
ncbi:MAG: hypothetical protein M1819_002549 [Sarea resinae]|nr:MAG: hypothetical protein M1819_002549 [Sarea resinae]